MATQYALSLAKVMEEERDGANGFVFQDCLSELIDNGFDAGSDTVSIASIQMPESYVMLVFDEGRGLQDPMDLYSCGKQVVKKTGGQRGLKNRGHRGTVGALTGRDRVVYVTRAGDIGRPSTLTVDIGGLFAALDEAKRAPTRDLNVVNAGEFFHNNKGGGLTDVIREFLQGLQDHSTHTATKEFLAAALTNSKPQYFMMAVCYETAIDQEEHEQAIYDALRSYRQIYAKALRAGKQIHFHALQTDLSYHLTEAEALPYLGTGPHIGGELDFLCSVDGVRTVLRFTVGDHTLWLHTARWESGDGRTVEGALEEPPTGIAALKSVASMEWKLAVISSEEEEAQKKGLGAHLDRIEQGRGVSLNYVDRSLGPAIYNPKWEAARNAGGVRCEIHCKSQAGAELFWNIQTQKNTMNFQVLHPMMKAFLNLLVNRTIIKKYSYCNILEGAGILEWNAEELCQMLKNPKSNRPAQPLPLPEPLPEPPLPEPLPELPLPEPLPELPLPEPLPELPTSELPSPDTVVSHIADLSESTVPGPSKTIVSGYERITAKSEKDVLTELITIISMFDLESLSESASSITCPEMTNIYKSLYQARLHFSKSTE